MILWGELMRETGYDDSTLFEEFCQGFKITGQATHSNEFLPGLQTALRSVDDLRQNSVWLKRRAIGKCQSSGDPQMDQIIWENGWICGPFSEQEIDAQMGHNMWLAARRFGLQQSSKVRLIDDCLSSGVNSAFSGTNKLTLMGIDALASMILCAMGCASTGKSFNWWAPKESAFR